jgi:hypothetical protein
MKSNTHIASSVRTRLVVLGAVAALVSTTIACSDSKPKQLASSSSQQPQAVTNAAVRPAVLGLTQDVTKPKQVSVDSTENSKRDRSKPIAFKSRDYGVSFQYPWQYTRMGARALAESDGSKLPKSDGFEGQFTLARVDIPKGFYPDTNFDSGYFSLSLNQEVSKEECGAMLGTDTKTVNVNGVDFKWVESENGGLGNSSKIRNYAAYTNYACYEIELGVNTQNEQGLSREIDADQVMRRLDSILQTVKITPEWKPSQQVSQNAGQ